MKKTLLSISIALTTLSFSAQTTLTNHFAWALTDPTAPEIAIYSWGTNGSDGYASGNNTFGDIGSAQLFDAATGVSGPGTISSLKAWIPIKNDAGGSIQFRIYANNGGAFGAQLGNASVTIASIDTTQAGVQLILDGMAIGGIYNVEVTFPTPIAFTSAGFWGIYTYGTGAGNVVAGGTTEDNEASYTLAESHSGVIASNGAFDNYGQYDLHCSHAIFPTVTFSPVSVEEMTLDATVYESGNSLYVTTYENNNATISLVNMMGQTVETFSHNSSFEVYNLSHLTAGIYLVNIANAEGKSTTQKIALR